MIRLHKIFPSSHVRLHTQIEIDASAERVWNVLADFGAYAEWNPFLQQVSGAAHPGAKLTVKVGQEGKRSTTFQVRVKTVDQPRELRWTSGLPVPRMFESEHYLCIRELGPDRVVVEQGESFSGVLVRFLPAKTRQSAVSSFEAMNAALKRRVEGN
ncbi:SRPBCC family protein [Sorangium sp. So ce362]|uniref:SRPBCC family protein n=1 Tax=Sorangium sp. So ce362 TaxID=3133303 RepID=UPI003F5E0222